MFTDREKIFTGLAKNICRWCAQFSGSDIDASGPEWHHHHSAIGARMGVLDTWILATVIAAHVPASVGEYRNTCHTEMVITVDRFEESEQVETVDSFWFHPTSSAVVAM